MDSVFRHVDPSEAEPHLYHIKVIRTNLSLVQLPVWRDQLNSGDVFILVCGEDKVWLWIGSNANADNWAKGSEVAMAFCKGGGVTVLDQGSNDGEFEAANFWGYLPGKLTASTSPSFDT